MSEQDIFKIKLLKLAVPLGFKLQEGSAFPHIKLLKIGKCKSYYIDVIADALSVDHPNFDLIVGVNDKEHKVVVNYHRLKSGSLEKSNLAEEVISDYVFLKKLMANEDLFSALINHGDKCKLTGYIIYDIT